MPHAGKLLTFLILPMLIYGRIKARRARAVRAGETTCRVLVAELQMHFQHLSRAGRTHWITRCSLRLA